jgi:hypothetical protein
MKNLEVLIDMVKRHEKVLYGNGQRGIIEIVDKMSDSLDWIKYLVLALLGVVLTAVTYAITFMPKMR